MVLIFAIKNNTFAFDMIRLKDKNTELPKPYPSITRVKPTAKKDGYTIIGGKMLRDGIDFVPQEGMQE